MGLEGIIGPTGPARARNRARRAGGLKKEAAVRCEDCQGKGVLSAEDGPRPCPECGGSGIVHCCEGLQAQPGTPHPAPQGKHPSAEEGRAG
jgi:DnaJ-class molecular chaperone